MARARVIKPAFFKNEILSEMDPVTRLLYIGLWTLADREGRLEDRPKRIKGELFPYEGELFFVDEHLERLEKGGFLKRYARGEQKFIQIEKFKKHQHVHIKEQPSQIPPPNGGYDDENFKQYSGNHQEYVQGKNGSSTGQAPDKHRTSTGQARPLTLTPLPLTLTPLTLTSLFPGKEEVEVFIEKNKMSMIDFVFYIWNTVSEGLKLHEKRTNKTNDRIMLLEERLNEGFDIIEVMQALSEQPFCLGHGKKGWKVTFDWLIKNEGNWLKVIELQYINLVKPKTESEYLKSGEKPKF